MAWYDTQQGIYNRFLLMYDDARWHCIYAAQYIKAAGTYLKAGNTETAGERLEQAGLWLIDGFEELICGVTEYPSINPIAKWMEYQIDNPVAVTWKAIVEAWVKDDFEGRFWTIGVIDRMRQILWNEPFDLTWAARPEDKKP